MTCIVTPPVFQSVGCKIGNVFRRAHTDMTRVSLGIVNSVRHGNRFGVRTEVVVVDLLALATPCLPGVFELADEFLLLRVDADARFPALRNLSRC